MKNLLKNLMCYLVLISANLALAPVIVEAQECFYPAHNFVSSSDDLTNSTYWTKPSTITDDTATTTPPWVFNVTKTFKGVGVAGQSNFVYGNTLNAYVNTGTDYIISAYVKYGTFQYLKFGVTGAGTYYANFDIQNGTYTGTAVGIASPGIESVGNGWYRIYGTYTGNYAGISKTFRLVFTYIATGASGGNTMAGGETFYLTSPWVMKADVPTPENKKYIPTGSTGYAAWGGNRVCPDQVWNSAAEGVYGATTLGGYLEKIKKYTANRMTKSGTAYTIYKDDKTTVYESGTTTGAGRTVP